MFTLEIIHAERPSAPPRAAIFDFDGTVSLIRRGWHSLLLGMSMDILRTTPQGKDAPEEELRQLIRRNVELNIGKMTIYQCYALADAVKYYGGTPREPEDYNRQYMNLLNRQVQPRLAALRAGRDPHELIVPGTYEMLDMLKRRGVRLYLASGTEDELVKEDAQLLRLTDYFDGGMYGGLPDPTAFSKAGIVKKMLQENGLLGEQIIGFGDGHTETVDVKAAGGFAVGVASDETTRQGVDPWKRDQLIRAGADWIIPDYGDPEQLESRIFDKTP